MTKPLHFPRKSERIAALVAALFATGVHASDFTIVSGQTVTTTQTLTGNDTGTVQAGGVIMTVGASEYGINASGANSTILNAGSIATAGNWGYAINSSDTGATIVNSGSIETAGKYAYGISSSGTGATIVNSGSITASGQNGFGIYSEGTGASIVNSGNITASGAAGTGICSEEYNASISNSGSITATGMGIRSDVASASIVNSGSITASDYGANGIYSTGGNASIVNSGSIVAAGDYANGIYSMGEHASIVNSGLLTAGKYRYGIESDGASASIVNSGSITAPGEESYGIYSRGASASIVNSGSITASGMLGVGIEADGANASIVNSGNITASGYGASGIYSSGDNTSLVNSGSIVAAGDHAAGIYSWGAHTSIVNSGLLTAGDYGYGIYSWGANTRITNSGNISTTGMGSVGIYSEGDNASISNSGSIVMSGDRSCGLYSTGASSTITNSGRIAVSGADAAGIYVNTGSGTSTTINLSGSVLATGNATQAIVGGDGNETLNLYAGSKVLGTVDLGSGTNVVNVITGNAIASSTIEIAGATSITQKGSGMSLVSGNTVALIDTTNLTAGQATLGNLSSAVFQSVSQQLNRTQPTRQPVQVAANGSLSGILPEESQASSWGQVFGQYNKNSSSGSALSYQDRHYGLVGGYEQRLGEHKAGVFGGVGRSNMNTSSASASTEGNSAYVGAYGQYAVEQWRINGVLALGYGHYMSDRTVTDNVYGTQTASGSYDAWYMSPSVSVMRILEQGGGFSWRPSAELNYTLGHLGSYSETGTTRSNLTVGSRTAQVLNTRVQVAAHQLFADKTGEYELRGGISHTNYGHDAAGISWQGVSTRYAPTGAGDVTGAYVGLNTVLHYKKNLDIQGDLEIFRSSDNITSVTAYAGLVYRF